MDLEVTTMRQSKPTTKTELGGVLLAASLLLAAAPGWAGHSDPYNTDPSNTDTYNTDGYTTDAGAAESSYSFARVVEGSATLLAVGGERESLEPNQPVLVGDRLWVPQGSRLEVVLADRSQLRLAGDSEVVFHRIAYSADSDGRVTALELRRGRLQLVVPDDALGEALPQIDTPAATVYIHREGSFRISAGGGWTELVVRDGLAELVTEGGSRLVHPGEMGWAEGTSRPRLEVRLASRRDDLERWGDQLTAEAAYDVPYVDRSLRYAAAPLQEYGGWVEVGGRRCWRPRVEDTWRPYYQGHWRHTPVGLTWVSYDPWGYVTHHYGSWDYAPAYGWVWYPGRVYAPARVHWYWGPTYVGWIPSGYYGHHYRHRHHGFNLRFGHYGWAGGRWDHWGHWTFAVTLNFGRRHGHGQHYDRHRYGDRHGDRHWSDRRHRDHGYHTGRELARERRELDRGIITTDPRVPAKDGPEVFASLKRQLTDLRQARGQATADVTDFVARKPLSGDVAGVVLRKPGKPAAGERGGWATGDQPLPTLAPRRRPADKPAGTVVSARPSTYNKPADAGTPSRGPRLGDRVVKPDRRTYDKPADAGTPGRRPTLSDRVAGDRVAGDRAGKPGSRGSTYGDKPGEVRSPTRSGTPTVRPPSSYPRPDVRKPSTPSTDRRRASERPGLSDRQPTTKPAPRTAPPRASTPRPTTKPAPRTAPPRASTPRPTYKPTPRTAPPRASTPRPTARPAPRAAPPRVSTPRPTYKPTPRTAPPRASTPRPTTRPAPRTTPPRASTPRPTRPTPRTAPPRVSSPRPTRPAPRTAPPRASTPRPSKPSPRVSSPPRSSRPAARPAPRASSAPRPKPQVSKGPSRSSDKGKAPSKRRRDG